MKNYPALFYATDPGPVSGLGYGLALLLVATGVAETVTALAVPEERKSPWLGALAIGAGGVVAYAYLKEADVVY